MTQRITLAHATIERTDYGCVSTFRDGSEVRSIPHPADPHYHVIAHRLGYGVGRTRDILHAYTFEHDFAHHFVADYLLDKPSPALWGVAHQTEVPPNEAAYEEMAVQMFQRWLRGNEQPIIAGVDWAAMRACALELLATAEAGA